MSSHRFAPVRLASAFLMLSAPLTVATASPAPQDTVVRTATAPVHRGVATLVEELSIGVADGEEAYMLGNIADIALGADGSLYAFDQQVPVLRQYDANGRFLRTIGRKGQGPGEYLTSSGIAATKDGRVLVWDTYGWRLNVYAGNGDFLTQWSTPSGSSGSSTAMFSRALAVDVEGNATLRKTIINIRSRGNQSVIWIRHRPDGSVLDTLRPPAWTNPLAPLVASAGGASMSTQVPFAPRREVVLSPLGYFVTGYPSRYAFEIHRPGQPILSVRREVPLEPVPRSERNSERARIEARMRQTDPAWSWNGPDIPETKPAYSGLSVGLDGRIWVALIPEGGEGVGMISGGGGIGGRRGSRPPAQSDAEPPRPALYDVFEPDGRYLGQVRIPPKVSTVLRRGNQIWAVALDEDDVPRIKRYRIQWGNG